MIKIELNRPLTDLEGKPVRDILLGKQLAEVLSASTKGNSIKVIAWAIDLWKGEPLQVDDSDKQWLREFVESSDHMANLLKAQLLTVINEAKNGKTESI